MQTYTEEIAAEQITAKLKLVMVVDDSLPDRFIADKMIHRYWTASRILVMDSAKSALNYFSSLTDQAEVPEILFLDIRMPEMDGFGFLEAFGHLPAWIQENCAIFMLTSSAYSEDKHRATQYPRVKGFLTKPLSEKALLEISS